MSTEVKEKKSKKSTSKTKGAEKVDATTEASVENGVDDKKEKKRKRKAEEGEAGADEPVASESSKSQPKEAKENGEKSTEKVKKSKEKKQKVSDKEAAPAKSKGQLSSSDIVGDANLSSAAQQALLYALQHSLHSAALKPSNPPIWKFNKAKQNWLLKHLWDVTEIPQQYTELVFGYVATVQGGRRRDVLDKAQEISLRPTASAGESAEETEASAPEDGAAASGDAEEVKRRAVRLLQLLQA